jgi:hypothetical protein
LDLEIAGYGTFDVTFHDGSGDSFNALWDADNDGSFGGPGSLFTAQPTFWGDQSGAELARDAIITALGSTGITTGISDSFFIPYGTSAGLAITSGTDNILVTVDGIYSPLTDESPTLFNANDNDATYSSYYPYASFAVSSVPIPPAIWLLSSGLAGLIGTARRKIS